jgi:hypothetical protein
LFQASAQSPTLLDSVEEQFLDYQGMGETDIPQNIWLHKYEIFKISNITWMSFGAI